MDDAEFLLPANKVRDRYNVSSMTIWRYWHDDEIGFPKPAMRIRGRPFWRLGDLRAGKLRKRAPNDPHGATVPIWRPEQGSYTDRCNVCFAGEIIVERSRDPETDLARALLERGHTGKVTLLDGETGKPRTIIDIEKAAKVRTVETGTYPRFRRVETCAPAGG